MTRDDVIRMAREAGIAVGFDLKSDEEMACVLFGGVDKFAQLIASHVAEECVKVCEKEAESWFRVTNGDCDDEKTALHMASTAIRSLYKPTA